MPRGTAPPAPPLAPKSRGRADHTSPRPAPSRPPAVTEPLVPVPKHLRIEPSWAGLTVLEAVRRAFPEVSAREVFRKARHREILVVERPCQPLDRLREGDLLSVVLFRPPRPATAAILQSDAEVETPAGPFWIVREDADLLAVGKPTGCASHPAHRHGGDTLIERVRAYLGVDPSDSFQPALANRLDIDTSGIVLIGKTQRAQSRLGRSLQRGLLDKFYLALVGGWPEPEGEIRLPLERHPDSRDLARHRMTGAALPAVKIQDAATRYRVLQRLGPPIACALLEVELLTGRTHQIRRHLTHLGHPLAADRRYGDPEFNAEIAEVADLRRLFLHAARVRLPHPTTGEELDLRAPLPEDLRAAMKALGGRVP